MMMLSTTYLNLMSNDDTIKKTIHGVEKCNYVEKEVAQIDTSEFGITSPQLGSAVSIRQTDCQ